MREGIGLQPIQNGKSTAHGKDNRNAKKSTSTLKLPTMH